jgi:putative SOS response-associated peptidase YedK
MCGRAYSTYTDEELEIRYGAKRPAILRVQPNYNFSPTQFSPVVRVRNDERVVETSKWGLIPFRPKPGLKSSFAPINAKAETVAEKPMFKHSFLRRRCIVPVSGFYEWKRCDETKRPFAIHLKDEKIMSMAGIYSSIELDDGEVLDTFAILTTEPNAKMADIHDRMPVILAQKDEEEWLDPENQDAKRLAKFLRPCPANWLETYEVSTLVNSPRNNSPEILRPV